MKKRINPTHTNARVKIYPTEKVIQVCNKAIFPVKKGNQNETKQISAAADDNSLKIEKECADPERSRYEARKRAEGAIRDIAKCNRFTYMLTLTLDAGKIDRYATDIIMKKLRPFLSNMSQRKGFQYLLVPEYHKLKQGEETPAIHFHGLCNLGGVKIAPAVDEDGAQRVDDAGRPIYNMVDWPYGWSMVVPLDKDYGKAVRYITKYVSKQKQKIFGKYYFCSRNLKKGPEIIPIPQGKSFYKFKDEDRIIGGVQSYHTLYTDTVLLSEIKARKKKKRKKKWKKRKHKKQRKNKMKKACK